MPIADNSIIGLHFTLTKEDGEIVDSTKSREPLHYLHGATNIVPGLEKHLTGKEVGDELSVTVQPEEAYGQRKDDLVKSIPSTSFADSETIEAGMYFHAENPDGSKMLVQVTDVNDDEITIDGNHPLAGLVLNYEVSIESIRDATEEELEHGHPHVGETCH